MNEEIREYIISRLEAIPILDKMVEDIEAHKEEILMKFIETAEIALKSRKCIKK